MLSVSIFWRLRANNSTYNMGGDSRGTYDVVDAGTGTIDDDHVAMYLVCHGV
jgi:hypothetical protein